LFFTAYECGEEKLESLTQIENGEYVFGVNFTLNSKPTGEMIDTFLITGFQCVENISGEECLNWENKDNPIGTSSLYELHKYADKIERDECIYCG